MKEVIILGIGPSRIECPFDAEVWATATALTTKGLEDRTYSKVFAFDSRKTPVLRKPLDIALERGIPVVSTKSYATEVYPYFEVIKGLGVNFTKNTVSYMIAYALYLGYKKIRLYGVDQGPGWAYIANRPEVFFWVGVAHGMSLAGKKDITIELAKGTLLSHLMTHSIRKQFKKMQESKEWSQSIWAENGPVFVTGQDVRVKITGQGYRVPSRNKIRHRRDILAYLILLGLYLIKPIRTVKLCHIRSAFIGQQAGNTGLFLRRLQMSRPKRTSYIGISGEPDNKQLLKMFKRKMTIIESKLLSQIHKEPILRKSQFFQDLLFPHDCFDEMRGTKPDLEFTAEEEKQGKELLKRMGVDSWFVCFLNRDEAFGLQKDKSQRYPGEFRNSDVDNFLEAAEYITKCGGYAIRMGHFVEKELKTDNPKIIDYASNYRTDFGDIYLPAKCKFYLGDTAGLWVVAAMFNTPVAGTNFIPFHTPLRRGDMFIPKRIYSPERKRELTMREYIDFDESTCEPSNMRVINKLLRLDYEIIENTSQEILDLAKEMNKRLDGTFRETKASEKAQEDFQSLLTRSDFLYGTPARISSKFKIAKGTLG